MIKHIVFFKFKPSITENEIAKLKKGLSALPGLIPEIKHYEFGRNVIHSERSYDFALIAIFDDLNSLQRYSKHPEHQKVLKLINEISDSIKSVDLESVV
ncbi:MAG: Dabb family protein [Bacteroidetes bacterium]|nr:Dabb family protein [Bacteroidota bacterium]MCL5738780.1 Dabb family protein [Bacteroidota bacterium]